MSRQDVQFNSHGEKLAAWIYPAKGASDNSPGPAIVLGERKEIVTFLVELAKWCFWLNLENFGIPIIRPRTWSSKGAVSFVILCSLFAKEIHLKFHCSCTQKRTRQVL